MKAIMISLSPEECANLLNGDMSVLVRKKISKDYVGWVYIYVTQGNALFDLRNESVDVNFGFVINTKNGKVRKSYNMSGYGIPPILNGKVVARFWCDKVEEVQYSHEKKQYFSESLVEKDLLSKSCLTDVELFQYLLFRKVGYAIHITDLEIFDKPKEISEFQGTCNKSCEANRLNVCSIKPNCNRPLTHAPSTYCYIEV